MKKNEPKSSELLPYATSIVSAYVSKNPLSVEQLPILMEKVHAQLKTLIGGEENAPRPAPAVPIKSSISEDYIICLEDGAKLKMLKRYLRTRFDMTPEEYRARWGLPADYPMVAPEYSKRRAQTAISIGLGRKKPRT